MERDVIIGEKLSLRRKLVSPRKFNMKRKIGAKYEKYVRPIKLRNRKTTFDVVIYLIV